MKWLRKLCKCYHNSRGLKKINEKIAKELSIKPQTVSHIINILISNKKVYNQINGELFDLDGNRIIVNK